MSFDKEEIYRVSDFQPFLDKIKEDLLYIYGRDYLNRDENMESYRSATTARTEEDCGSIYQQLINDLVPSEETLASKREIEKKDKEIEDLKMQLRDSEIKNEEILVFEREMKKKDKDIEDLKILLQDRDSEIKSFELSIKDLTTLKDTLQKDVTEKQQKIDENNDIIVEKDKYLKRLKENKKTDQMMKDNEVIIEEKNKNIQDQKRMISELESELKRINAEYDKIIKQKDDELSKMTTQHDCDVDEKEALQKELEEKIKLTHTLTEETKNYKFDLNELKENNSNQAELIEDLQTKLEHYESKESSFDDNYRTMTDNYKRKKHETKTLKELNDELKEKLSVGDRERNRLLNKLERIRKDCDELEESNAENDKEIKDLRKKLRVAEKQVADIEGNEKYLKEIQNLKSEVNNLKKQIDELTSQNNDMKKHKAMTERQVKDYEMDIANRNSEVTELKKKFDNAKKEIVDKEKIIKDKQTALENMKQKLKTPQPTNENDSKILQRTIDAKDAEMDQMEQKIENYKHSLELKYLENEKLQKDHDALNKKYEDLRKQKFNETMGGNDRQSFFQSPPKPNVPKPSFSKPNSPLVTLGNLPQFPEWWLKHMNT